MDFPHLIALVAAIWLVSFLVLRFLRHRRALQRISREAVDVINPETLERFRSIAADSLKLDFIAKRAFVIRFRNREIPIIEGDQGCVYVGDGTPYHSEGYLLTYASPDETAWFAAQKDVFQVAYSGAEGVIYFVDAGKI